MPVSWKEDDQDTLVLFLETILDNYREGTMSRAQAVVRITELFTQAGLSTRSVSAYMQSVIQERRDSHTPSFTPSWQD